MALWGQKNTGSSKKDGAKGRAPFTGELAASDILKGTGRADLTAYKVFSL